MISEITLQDVKAYGRIDYDDDDILIESIMLAVKAYIRGYTGLDTVAMDTKDDLVIVFMVLSRDMYLNRQYIVDKDKVNVVTKTILDMHSINLL